MMNDDVDVDEVVMLRCLRKKSVTLQVKGKSSRGSQGIRSRGVTQLQLFFFLLVTEIHKKRRLVN